VQECRLISHTQNGGTFTPDLCAHCRVPRILMANACPNMILEARVTSRLLGLHKRVQVTANCTRTSDVVNEPEIGCGQCHLALPSFDISEEQT
jgi:hypothetical protein